MGLENPERTPIERSGSGDGSAELTFSKSLITLERGVEWHPHKVIESRFDSSELEPSEVDAVNEKVEEYFRSVREGNVDQTAVLKAQIFKESGFIAWKSKQATALQELFFQFCPPQSEECRNEICRQLNIDNSSNFSLDRSQTDRVKQVQEKCEAAVVDLIQDSECGGTHIAITVEELLINHFLHGNKLDLRKGINLKFGFTKSGEFVMESCDEGSGFDASLVKNEVHGADLMKSSGRGLVLAFKYSAHMIQIKNGTGWRVLFNWAPVVEEAIRKAS